MLISISFVIAYSSIKFNNLGPINILKINILIFLILFFRNIRFFTTKIIIILLGIELTIYPLIKIFIEQSKDKDKISSLIFIFNINMAGSILLVYTLSNQIIDLNCFLISFNIF